MNLPSQPFKPSFPTTYYHSNSSRSGRARSFGCGDKDDPDASGGIARSEPKKILIIDDDPVSRLMIARGLRNGGYLPVEAGSPDEALKSIRNEPPLAVIINFDLPLESRTQAIADIRSTSPRAVILAVTPQGRLAEISESDTAKVHLRRPIDTRNLRAVLQSQDVAEPPSRQSSSLTPSKHDRGKGRKAAGVSPLGKLIQDAMKLLGLSYQQIVRESNRLAMQSNNPDMRIGKSTLGNIINGVIRQPSTAKLDSLRILLHLAREQLDLAIGLAPERRFVEQLELKSHRTHELTPDAVTRQRLIRIPILSQDANPNNSQFLSGMVERWASVEVEYLTSFYPPYLRYVIIGEGDNHASPVAPPGTRVLVNTLLTQVREAQNVSFHERELYCVLTRDGLTCSYLEVGPAGKIVLVPHALSGHVREEVSKEDVTIVGLVVGILLRN